MASSIQQTLSTSYINANPTPLFIANFFRLSRNLTSQETEYKGEIYQLLEQLFDMGYTIEKNEFIAGNGFAAASWPSLQKEGVSLPLSQKVKFSYGGYGYSSQSLLNYLKNLMQLNKQNTEINTSVAITKTTQNPFLNQSSSNNHSYSSSWNSPQAQSKIPFSSLSSKINSSSSETKDKTQNTTAWGLDPDSTFCGTLSSALQLGIILPDEEMTDKKSEEIQDALHRFDGCKYYQTVNGQEVIMKDKTILASHSKIPLYPPAHRPHVYMREDGKFTTNPIKNIKLILLLSDKEAILKIIHRLMKIPLVNPK